MKSVTCEFVNSLQQYYDRVFGSLYCLQRLRSISGDVFFTPFVKITPLIGMWLRPCKQIRIFLRHKVQYGLIIIIR